MYVHAVEPPNKGHFGSRHFIIIIERLSFGGRLNNTKSIQMVPWRVSLMRGCPLVGGSFRRFQKGHCKYKHAYMFLRNHNYRTTGNWRNRELGNRRTGEPENCRSMQGTGEPDSWRTTTCREPENWRKKGTG